MVETEIYRGRLRCDAGLAALDLGASPARDVESKGWDVVTVSERSCAAAIVHGIQVT